MSELMSKTDFGKEHILKEEIDAQIDKELDIPDEAIQLRGNSVAVGNLIQVYNKKRPKFSNAKKVYTTVYLKGFDKTIKPAMFTEAELEKNDDRKNWCSG